jgi:hypothetical protein
VVDAFKENLKLDGLFESRRLIFVCHSMGGIVVRKFLVERSGELLEHDIDIGLFFLASPSLGSSYANWLAPLARVLGHAQAEALRFTQSNAWLNDLDKEFLNLKEAGRLHIKGKELVEDRFVMLWRMWRRQVVEPFSGARYFGEPLKIAGSDHFSIAKPEDDTAIQHRLLVQFIKDMQDEPVAQDQFRHNPIVTHNDPLAQFATRIDAPAVFWDDIVLQMSVISQINEIVEEVKSSQSPPQSRSVTYETSGTQILFHGPPGTGKRLAARAIANHLAVELYTHCCPVNKRTNPIG